MKIHTIISFIILLFSVNFSYSQTSIPTTPTVDSLLNLIDNSSGQEVFDLYPEMLDALYEIGDMDIHLKYTQQYIDAARAYNNKKEEMFAIRYRISVINNYNQPDSIIIKESFDALSLMKDVPNVEQYYFQIASVIVDTYMLSGNYDYGLQMANKFYNEAKEINSTSGISTMLLCLGQAYYALDLYEKAKESLYESISVGDEIVDVSSLELAHKFLIEILINMDLAEEALDVCKKYESFLDRSETSPGTMDNQMVKSRFTNSLSYVVTYKALKEFAKAEKYLAKAEAFPLSNLDLAIYMLEDARYHLMIEQAKYIEAEKALDRIDETYGQVASFQDKRSMEGLRADLYFRWEKYDKAAHAYREYMLMSDSIKKIEMATSLHSIRTQYEVDKLEMQKEQDERFYYNTLMWFILVLVLLCAIIIVVMINVRKLRSKNRSLLDRIREKDEQEHRYEQLRNELAQKSTTPSKENIEGEGSGELYFKLKELMKDPCIFTEPNINRKIIAEKLGTNEKYVFDVIKEYYGTNISDYINSLRLNYARDLLADSSDKRTIDIIALEAGFNSRSVFYRLFKEHYGMTPLEFRRLVASI